MEMSRNRRALYYVIFILSFTALFYVAEIIHMFDVGGVFNTSGDKIFQKIEYGYTNEFLINMCKWGWYGLVYIGAFFYTRKFLVLKDIDQRPKELPLSRVLILYGTVVLFIFIVTACLNFKVKVVYDLGENITSYDVSNRISTILTGVVKMPMIVLIIRYVHELVRLYAKKNYLNMIPFGGIYTLLAFGIYDLIVSGVSTLSIVFLFLHLIYGLIYFISYRNYIITCVVNAILHVL